MSDCGHAYSGQICPTCSKKEACLITSYSTESVKNGGFSTQYDILSKQIKEMAKKIDELQKEKDLWCMNLGHKGTVRECGHFVNTVLSFCPVCQELESKPKKVMSVEKLEEILATTLWNMKVPKEGIAWIDVVKEVSKVGAKAIADLNGEEK